MDADAQTVANFLKFYNPSIVGGSLGSHIGEVSQKEHFKDINLIRFYSMT
jgi:hypothetical protein